MFKLLLVFTLNGVPTGEGYIGQTYDSEEECVEAMYQTFEYILPLTTADDAIWECTKVKGMKYE